MFDIMADLKSDHEVSDDNRLPALLIDSIADKKSDGKCIRRRIHVSFVSRSTGLRRILLLRSGGLRCVTTI